MSYSDEGEGLSLMKRRLDRRNQWDSFVISIKRAHKISLSINLIRISSRESGLTLIRIKQTKFKYENQSLELTKI